MDTTSTIVHSLPRQTTSFIGRLHEIAEVVALLDNPDCQLLTLLGPGGIGKTRLAIEVARQIRVNFPDGVHYVALQPVHSVDQILHVIINILGFTVRSIESAHQQLLWYLSDKRLLLLLDNFEHLPDGAGLVADILAAAPFVKVLVTSRETLKLREEWLWDVRGLSYPKPDLIISPETYSAIQLFIERARQVHPDFTLTEDCAAVVRICQLVEGIPLAVELAAAWVRVMSCAEIAREIEHSLDVLTTTLGNVPERHHSMRATFERSWDLLTSQEQAVFRKLSVFRGGFTREAADQVAEATLAILALLVHKSVVRVDVSGRYDLHELLRQYAAEKLLEAGEVDTTAQRHGDYFLKLAEGAEAHAFGREQIAWFDRLEVDFDNLRTALIWSLQSGDAETGLRLAGALGWFFSERAHWSEGLDWLERMLTANPYAPASLRAKALHSAGALAGWLEDDQRTRALCGQALTLARAANDRWNIAWSLSHLGNYTKGDPDQSAALLEESLVLFRDLGDAMGVTHTLVRRAWKAIQAQRDYAYGRALLEEGSIRAHVANDKVMTAWVQYMQGLIAWLQDNNLLQAKSHFESCVSLFREARCPFYNVLILLADVEQTMGNTARAQLLYEESLISLRESMPDHTYLSWVLAGLVSVARSLRQLDRAAQLLGAANGLALGEKRNSHDIANFDLGTAAVAAVRDQLGDPAFTEAWAAGNAMTPDKIIAYALEGRTPPTEQANVQAKQSLVETLTDRELEVLYLIAEGLSNRDIASTLTVVEGTVRTHVYNICQKLGARNRTQAVARARALHIL